MKFLLFCLRRSSSSLGVKGLNTYTSPAWIPRVSLIRKSPHLYTESRGVCLRISIYIYVCMYISSGPSHVQCLCAGRGERCKKLQLFLAFRHGYGNCWLSPLFSDVLYVSLQVYVRLLGGDELRDPTRWRPRNESPYRFLSKQVSVNGKIRPCLQLMLSARQQLPCLL